MNRVNHNIHTRIAETFKRESIGIRTGRTVLFLLIFIHMILPYTSINRHEGSHIKVAAFIIGMVFLWLVWNSYRSPNSYLFWALVFFWVIVLIAAISGASPILEGIFIKILFSLGLLWGILQSRNYIAEKMK